MFQALGVGQVLEALHLGLVRWRVEPELARRPHHLAAKKDRGVGFVSASDLHEFRISGVTVVEGNDQCVLGHLGPVLRVEGIDEGVERDESVVLGQKRQVRFETCGGGVVVENDARPSPGHAPSDQPGKTAVANHRAGRVDQSGRASLGFQAVHRLHSPRRPWRRRSRRGKSICSRAMRLSEGAKPCLSTNDEGVKDPRRWRR